jgi:hypothetical protein
MAIEQEITNLDRESKRGRFKPGKSPKIDRGFGNGHQQIYNDYFSENPVYPESKFRRHFRMSSRLMKQIIRDVEEHDSKFFSRRPDDTGKLGASLIQKITAAIRMLAYGSSADACDEYTRISKELARVSLKRFSKAIFVLYESKFLRPSKYERDAKTAYNEQIERISFLNGQPRSHASYMEKLPKKSCWNVYRKGEEAQHCIRSSCFRRL